MRIRLQKLGSRSLRRFVLLLIIIILGCGCVLWSNRDRIGFWYAHRKARKAYSSATGEEREGLYLKPSVKQAYPRRNAQAGAKGQVGQVVIFLPGEDVRKIIEAAFETPHYKILISISMFDALRATGNDIQEETPISVSRTDQLQKEIMDELCKMDSLALAKEIYYCDPAIVLKQSDWRGLIRKTFLLAMKMTTLPPGADKSFWHLQDSDYECFVTKHTHNARFAPVWYVQYFDKLSHKAIEFQFIPEEKPAIPHEHLMEVLSGIRLYSKKAI